MAEILNGPSISRHDKPKKLIFMLHGYGDNAENFMHLAHPIDHDDWQAQYISLNGPGVMQGNFIGYQWFNLYPNGIYIAEAGPKEFKIIQKEINDVAIRIVKTIKQYASSLDLKLSDCLLMGFSQGGMMTFEVGNFLKEKLAGLVILSGRIMKEESVTNSVLQQTPIFISHGEKDEVIPITSFHKSINYLNSNKCNYESHALPNDEHNISPEAIILLKNFIKKIL